MERAVHRLQPIFLILDARRGVHRIGVITLMTARHPQVALGDVRRENEAVTAALQLVAQEPLHLRTDYSTLRVPEDQPCSVLVRDREKVQLAAQLAVVALLRFLTLLHPRV